MRRLVALLVVAAVAVGADLGAARLFEGRVTSALDSRYDLGDRPSVRVRDFPFLPHLLTGRLSDIDLAGHDARAGGIDLASVAVHLRGVHVPRAVLLGGRGRVLVDRADGELELTQAQINRLLGERLRGGSVEVGADGLRLQVSTSVLGRTVDAVVTGRLGVRDGRVAFQPEAVQVGGVRDPALEARLASAFAFTVPLPPLPGDIKVERVSTVPGVVTLTGSATAVEIAA